MQESHQTYYMYHISASDCLSQWKSQQQKLRRQRLAYVEHETIGTFLIFLVSATEENVPFPVSSLFLPSARLFPDDLRCEYSGFRLTSVACPDSSKLTIFSPLTKPSFQLLSAGTLDRSTRPGSRRCRPRFCRSKFRPHVISFPAAINVYFFLCGVLPLFSKFVVQWLISVEATGVSSQSLRSDL